MCKKPKEGEIPKQAVLTWCFLYEEVGKKIDHQELKTKNQSLVVKHKDTEDANMVAKITWKKGEEKKRGTCGQRHRESIAWGSLTSRITDTESMESFLEKDCYLLALVYTPKFSTAD